jgi:hypothetical protein
VTTPIAMAGWVWLTTTVVAALATAAAIAVLMAHVLVTAAGGSREGSRRRSLRRLAVPLVACFAAVVLVRLTIIVIERPGP